MRIALHVMKRRRLSWCSNTASGQQVEPIITVEGVSMPTYEYHCQACDRTFAIHQSLEGATLHRSSVHIVRRTTLSRSYPHLSQ